MANVARHFTLGRLEGANQPDPTTLARPPIVSNCSGILCIARHYSHSPASGLVVQLGFHRRLCLPSGVALIPFTPHFTRDLPHRDSSGLTVMTQPGQG